MPPLLPGASSLWHQTPSKAGTYSSHQTLALRMGGDVACGRYGAIESNIRLRMHLRIIYTLRCAVTSLTPFLEFPLLPPR